MGVFWTSEEDGERGGGLGGDENGRASCSISGSEEEGGFF